MCTVTKVIVELCLVAYTLGLLKFLVLYDQVPNILQQYIVSYIGNIFICASAGPSRLRLNLVITPYFKLYAQIVTLWSL